MRAEKKRNTIILRKGKDKRQIKLTVRQTLTDIESGSSEDELEQHNVCDDNGDDDVTLKTCNGGNRGGGARLNFYGYQKLREEEVEDKCSLTTTTMTTFDNIWIRQDVVKHFVNRAMDIHKQVGELRLMSEFDLQWLPPSYLKRNTKSTEITEAWEQLLLDIRNNQRTSNG
ncbi:hypothetical protein FQA39_LY09737 [Lamprigera yunnana]|nr:hypothetical protein FQA39_LY09737 [Lamprigera yunnana]